MRTPIKLLILVLMMSLLGAASVQAQAPEEGGITIAVLPFEINADPSFGNLEGQIPMMLAKRLQEKGFQTIDQNEVNRIIRQKNIDYLDVSLAKDVAVLAGAQYSVYGSLNQVGETMSLDVRLVDAFGVRAPKPLAVTDTSGSPAGPVDKLAEKIRSEILVEGGITEIVIRGTKYLDEDVIIMRMKLQKGDPYDPALVNEEIKRIFDLGYFEDVRILAEDAAGGKRLIIEVVEKPRIEVIDVLGAEDMDEDDIIGIMNTKEGSVLNPKVLSDDLNNIRDLYKQEGYYNAHVSYELEETGTGTARLNVVVKEGAELHITEIVIEGCEQLDPDDVDDDMALSERSIISWITGSGVLNEELLERDAASIKAYYQNRGFMDVKVAEPEVEYLEDGIRITHRVEEGTRYRIGDVAFRGDLLEPEATLMEIINFDDMAADGEWFNREALQKDRDNLTTFYNDYGYAFADVNVGMKNADDAEEPSISVTFVLAKNQKVHIRRVAIDGNDKTRDNVILREMFLADGQPFSGTLLNASLRRLDGLGIFETVEIETVPADDPSQMDLIVHVKEKGTGAIAGGVGYASDPGVFVSGTIEEKNLFGMGYTLSLMGSWSADDSRYTLSFVNPHMWDSKWGWGIDLYRTDLDYSDFSKKSTGLELKFFRPFGRYSKLFLSYQIESYEIFDVEPDATAAIKDIEGERWSSEVSVAFLRDSTNRNLNPSSGSKNSMALSYGGGLLMGDDNYFKVVADSSWYFSVIPEWDHIIHLRGQTGAVFQTDSGDEIPVFQRFRLGGINSIRGYPHRIGTYEDGDLIGGQYEAFMNLEYLFPIAKDVGLIGLVFFDMGDAWGEDDFELQKSVGVGLRWYSPIGPLRFEYGYALDEIEDQGDRHRFEFSVGQFF